MKKIVLGCLVGGAAVVFAACGSSSPCQTYVNTITQLGTLAAPCAGDGGAAPTDGGGPNVTSCNTAYNSTSCTSADQTELTTLANNYSTCVGAIAACTTATEAAFGMSELACTAPIVAATSAVDGGTPAVSVACSSAVGPTIGL